MPSIIEGYNYDIFISYRQKDNKHDGWVTEFVNNLKGELESTFKEDISVYFDINPHDGLLETHDVNESLKEKLRCLIFIPIISRTYCDPKSFAWEHEFRAFVEMAANDQYGLKVKLPNGNVASRILPIRIYELDANDIMLCESLLGGMLRGVEFIYKSSGVNRPLRAKEEKPQDNSDNTLYRDQINKVANAIRDIITGLSAKLVPESVGKMPSGHPSVEKGTEPRPSKAKIRLNRKTRITAGIVFLLIGAIIIYPKLFKQDLLENLKAKGRISIAVMPFKNLINNPDYDSWQNLIQYNLSNSLSNSGNYFELRQVDLIENFIQTRNITNYASLTPSVAGSISEKLDADIFIIGTIGLAGSTIRLYTQIIDTRTRSVLKSFQRDISAQRKLTWAPIDTLAIMIRDFLEISELKKESPANLSGMLSTCNSPEAYKYFIAGKKAFEKRDFPSVFENLTAAIKADTNFTYAPILLAQAYPWVGMYDDSKRLVLKQYSKRDRMSPLMRTYINYIYAAQFETPVERIKYLNQLLEYDNQSTDYHYLLGNSYMNLFQYGKAIPEFEKTLEINNRLGTKPWYVFNYIHLGICYHETGQYRKEKKIYLKAEKDFPGDEEIPYRQAIMTLSQGKTVEANKYIEKYLSAPRSTPLTDAGIAGNLAHIYSEANLYDQADIFYRKALKLDSVSWRINELAYFLIDKDLNVNEGLKLIGKALTESPENYIYLHTKGWGLYKAGNFMEAREILQKAWTQRMEKAVYQQGARNHLDLAVKAAEGIAER